MTLSSISSSSSSFDYRRLDSHCLSSSLGKNPNRRLSLHLVLFSADSSGFAGFSAQRGKALHRSVSGARSTSIPRRPSNTCACGSAGNVYFVLSSGHDIYEDMDADKVDIPFLWNRLQSLLSYLTKYERRDVFIGLCYADHAHEGQFRKSGEPFITHPVEVARILAALGSDVDTIIAGLLHDTVEDTDKITFEEIEKKFGCSVQKLVRGETRFTKINQIPKSDENFQDYDFLHFFDSVAQDIRILFVKLADRLHNMRTMDSMCSIKQQQNAEETLEIFVPLARLLGLQSIQEELEELSLRYLFPQKYRQLKDHLAKFYTMQEDLLQQTRSHLEEKLKKDRVLATTITHFKIFIRQKSFFSLFEQFKEAEWKLDYHQHTGQLAQLHIQLKSVEASPRLVGLCFYVLSIVHGVCQPINGCVEDCINCIKLTSWKGIKTMVRPTHAGRLVSPVNVLIQTAEMLSVCDLQSSTFSSEWIAVNSTCALDDAGTNQKSIATAKEKEDLALLGSAQRNGVETNRTISRRVMDSTSCREQNVVLATSSNGLSRSQLWLESLKKMQGDFGPCISPRDYVDCVRNDLLRPVVLVYTASGECVQLPKGATVMDFAYNIHTFIGNRAIGATVDGCQAELGYSLQTGQLVELQLVDIVRTSEQYFEMLESRLNELTTASAKRQLKLYLQEERKAFKKKVFNNEVESPTKSEKKFAPYFHLRVECVDRDGILAEVSQTIHEQRLSVRACSCEQLKGIAVMKYKIEATHATDSVELCSILNTIKGVTNISTESNIAIDFVDADDWWRSTDKP